MTKWLISGCAAVVIGGFLAIPVMLLLIVTSVGGFSMSAQASCGVKDTVTLSGKKTDLSKEQLENAEIIVNVAKRSGLGPDAMVLGIAAALQESNLINVKGGHADSQGLFQQRPSTGWGTVKQVTTPKYAAGAFYGVTVKLPNEQLVDIKGWKKMKPTLAIQAVQKSAFPFAYEDDIPTARQLVRGISKGQVNFGTCPNPKAAPKGIRPDGTWPPEQMLPMGLTPRTKLVMNVLRKRFPRIDSIGGFCPGGCTNGHISSSDHYDGHAIDAMLVPHTSPEMERVGDRISLFLIKNQRRYAVKYLIWNDRIWLANEAEKGWQEYTHPSGSNNPTLRHLDHVHVSVY